MSDSTLTVECSMRQETPAEMWWQIDTFPTYSEIFTVKLFSLDFAGRTKSFPNLTRYVDMIRESVTDVIFSSHLISNRWADEELYFMCRTSTFIRFYDWRTNYIRLFTLNHREKPRHACCWQWVLKFEDHQAKWPRLCRHPGIMFSDIISFTIHIICGL